MIARDLQNAREALSEREVLVILRRKYGVYMLRALLNLQEGRKVA